MNATLQQVVQSSNDQQSQAIATKDLSVLTDPFTDEYRRLTIGVLQEMLDAHVKAITLTKVEWGPISVTPDGSSASVTTYESWRITSQEAFIDYDPVRNDYTLVMDNGAWRIKSNVQTLNPPPTPTGQTATPTATPTATLTPTPAPTATPSPTPTATPMASEEMPAMPGEDMPAAPPGNDVPVPPPGDPPHEE